jgi:hypothetical protein
MPPTLAELKTERTALLQQFLTLGDFRPGTVSATPRRCGKLGCRCAKPNAAGHPQFRLLRKEKGKSVSESFATPSALRQAAEQVQEYHRFRALVAQLTEINERICRLRPTEPDQTGWSEAEKKRLLRFIRQSQGKSKAFSK